MVKRQIKYTRQTPAQLYGAEPEVCAACRAFGVGTTSEFGRTITVLEQGPGARTAPPLDGEPAGTGCLEQVA